MTSFDDRRSSFESKYAHDQDLRFKIEARSCKNFGLWAAAQMGLDEKQSADYASEIIAANLEKAGFDDVIGKVAADLSAKGVEVSEHSLHRELEHILAAVEEELTAG